MVAARYREATMLWISAGLFCIGIACGATLRLPIFIGVLLGAIAIAALVASAHGLAETLLTVLLTLVVLQLGYGAGFVLRAAGRSFFPGIWMRGGEKRPATAPLGGKRR
jgi:hypothetical protein